MSRELGPVTVQGKPLRCMVCGHDSFWEQHISVSTAMFSFLDPDSTAHCAVCSRCGYVHMFLPKGTVESDEKTPAPAPAAPPAPA